MDGRLYDLLRKQTQRADETAKRAIEDGAKSLKPGSLLNRARKRTGEKVAKGFRAEADAAYADVKRELDRIADAAADETARKIEALTGKPAKAARGAVDGRQLRADLRRSNASRAKNAERALGRAVKGTPPGKRDAAASEAAKSAWKDVAKSRQRKRFVDSRGRAWKDSVYNEMRAKTMEANAKRAAQIATLRANGFKLARITDGVQETTCEDCHLWRGAIVSLTGRAYRGYPALEKVVATTKLFHPNCIHYIEPYQDSGTDGKKILSIRQLMDGGKDSDQQKAGNGGEGRIPDSDVWNEISGMMSVGERHGMSVVLRSIGIGKRILANIGEESPFAKELKAQIDRLSSVAKKIASEESAAFKATSDAASERDAIGNAERAKALADLKERVPDIFARYRRTFNRLPTRALSVVKSRVKTISYSYKDSSSYSVNGHVRMQRVDRGGDLEYRIANFEHDLLHECGHAAFDMSPHVNLRASGPDDPTAISSEAKAVIASLENECETAVESLFGKNWRSDERLLSSSRTFARTVSEEIFGCDFNSLPPTYQNQVMMFSDLVQNATKGLYGSGHTDIPDYFKYDYMRASELCAEATSCYAIPENAKSLVMKHFGATMKKAVQMLYSCGFS